MNKSDVYVAPRRGAENIKVSLHASGYCQYSDTPEFYNKMVVRGKMDRRFRHYFRWRRNVEIPRGESVQAFRIVIPTSELVEFGRFEREGKSVVWLTAPPEGYSSGFYILFSGRGTPRKERGVHLLKYMELENGQVVWILFKASRVTPDLAEEIRKVKATKLTDPLPFSDGDRKISSLGPDARLVISGKDSIGLYYFVECAFLPKEE